VNLRFKCYTINTITYKPLIAFRAVVSESCESFPYIVPNDCTHTILIYFYYLCVVHLIQ
jgi:hypothetical protein